VEAGNISDAPCHYVPKRQTALESTHGCEASLVRNDSEKLLVRVDARGPPNSKMPEGVSVLAHGVEQPLSPRHLPHRPGCKFWSDPRAETSGRLEGRRKELEKGGEKRVVRSEHHPPGRGEKTASLKRGPGTATFAFAPLSDVPGR